MIIRIKRWLFPGSMVVSLMLGLSGCGRQETQSTSAPTEDKGSGARVSVINKRTPDAPARPDVHAQPTVQSRVQRDDELLSGTDPLLLVKGSVTLANGSPASGATVELIRPQTRRLGLVPGVLESAVTDADGKYRLVVRGTSGLVRAAYPHCATELTQLRDREDMTVQPLQGTPHSVAVVNFRMKRGAVLEGIVLDSAGKPLAGAHVASARLPIRNVPSPASETSTTLDGTFRLDTLTTGASRIHVSAPGYIAALEPVAVPGTGQTIRLVEGGATVAGIVREKRSGQPVEGVNVLLGRESSSFTNCLGLELHTSSTTDANGAYRIENLAAGTYQADARSDKLRLLPRQDPGAYRVNVAQNQVRNGVDLVVYGGHAMRGVVKEKYTSTTLAGVRLASRNRSDEEGASTVSGPDGAFELNGIFAEWSNRINVEATKPGYVLDRSTVQPELSIDELEIQKDLLMVKAVRVSGTVRTPNGQPAVGARVSRLPKHGNVEVSVPVDQAGRYEMEVEPNSAFLVVATAPSYPPAGSKPLRTSVASMQDIDITLAPGAALAGTVQDSDGQPIADASISVRSNFSEGSMFVAAVDRNIVSGPAGEFRIAGLPALNTTLVALKSGYQMVPALEVPLAPGETTTGLILVLPKGCKLAGRVTTKQGVPVEEAEVSWGLPGTNLRGQMTTNAEGRYSFDSVTSQPVDIMIRKSGEAFPFPKVATGREDADFEIDLKPKVTLTGKVVDWKTSQPVSISTVECNLLVEIVQDPNRPGEFVARDLAPAMKYDFTITADGYRTLRTAPVEMPTTGTTLTKTFVMGPGGRVQGRVVVKGSKTPVAKADVSMSGTEIDPDSGPRCKSGSDGRFLLEGVPAGERLKLRVTPEAPFLVSNKEVRVGNGDDTDLGDIEVSAGAKLTGKVVRVPGEVGIPDTPVSAKNQDTRTGPDGSFQFVGLSPGQVEVMTPEFGQMVTMVQILADRPQTVTIRVGSVTMKGMITKAGQPQRAEVMLINLGTMTMRQAQSDANGAYEMKNVLPGSQMAGLQSSRGGQVAPFPITIPDQAVFEKNFELPAAVLRGLVLDPAGKPAAEVQLKLRKPNFFGIDDLDEKRDAVSDANGNYQFKDLAGGAYNIVAVKEKVGRASAEGVKVAEGGEATVPPLTLRSESGTLESVVLDFESGEPLQYAQCQITRSNGVRIEHSAKRDSNGVMVISDLSPGDYTVEVSASRYSKSTHPVQIKAGETVRIEDVLWVATEIIVIVSDKAGSTVIDAECELKPEDSTSVQATLTGKTNALGIWMPGPIMPGSYTITARSGAKRGTRQYSTTGANEQLVQLSIE